jgi:hypothetical protein
MSSQKPIEFDGARDLWEKAGDPRWVWRAIRDRIHHHEPLPDWVLDYLYKVAAGIERAKGDVARELLPALGFPAKPGRKRDRNIDLLSEQFVMAFAAEIFRGSSAGKARKKAAERCGRWKDDKDRKRQLKDFFELEKRKQPWSKTNLQWRLEISRWLLLHPWYTGRYPDLPSRFDFKSAPRG